MDPSITRVLVYGSFLLAAGMRNYLMNHTLLPQDNVDYIYIMSLIGFIGLSDVLKSTQMHLSFAGTVKEPQPEV